MALIYKDITVTNESTWGVSLAGDPDRLHITSINLNLDENKMVIQDTSGTPKGFNRMTTGKYSLEGDIKGYVTPTNIHHALELVMGTSVTVGSSCGASATLFYYYQDVSGTLCSKAINIDRTNSQERYNGVRAKSLEITATDALTEFTLHCIGKSRGLGATVTDYVIGESIRPFIFADWTIYINAGNTSGPNGVTVGAKTWTLTYDNQQETTYLSGNQTPSRTDAKVPTLEGSFSLFHDGTSWTDATYGASEFFLRFQGVLPSERGLIAGVTPFMLRLDIPRVQLMKTVRGYADDTITVEDFKFTAMFDPGSSTLWYPQQTAGVSIS